MNFIKNVTLVFFFIALSQSYSYSESPYYIDFKYILNESVAGKGAQKKLKDKLSKGIKSLNNKEKQFRDEEKKIITQKKIVSAEEYKEKVQELRKKVVALQKERNSLLDGVAKERSKARNELLKNLNPIVKQYMEEKKIRMVIDKKSLLFADDKLDITQDIIKILNSKLKSIKLN